MLRKNLFILIILSVFLSQSACCEDSQKDVLIKSILTKFSNCNITINDTPRGIVTSFPENVIFENNSIKLSCCGELILSQIGQILNSIENSCTIEGHSSRFKGLEAFEASIMKADVVGQYLITQNPNLQNRIFTVGLSDFEPIEATENNNRIDIVFFAYELMR